LKKIIYVPGKNPKPPPSQHREQLFRCLLQGVQRIDPAIADDIAATDSFTLVAWNRHFYDAVIDIEQITPWVDRLLAQQTFPESDIAAVRSIKYRLARLLYQLGDHLHWLIPLIPDKRIKASIQETERYFSNHNDIACKIRGLQKQPLREAAENDDKVLLIGHSMGSIIAYDSLWELHHLENLEDCVDTLLTIGSPLGMHYVQQHLSGLNNQQVPSYPGNLRQWINVSARGDLVALDRSLADDFRAMIDHQQIESITDWREDIFNHYRDSKGLNVHKSYGYLINPVVSKTIADWWRTV